MDKAAEMLEYVRQCASVAAEVARRLELEDEPLAFGLATLYDGLLEIYEEDEGGELQG